MASYHLSMKAVSRSAGRSSTAAAAYRAGEKIIDERTGEIHDYTRKGGIESTDIVLPDGCKSMTRAELWNGVEKHHKRGDALVAREFEIALPDELSRDERRRLAVDFAREVANHYSVAADVCIHAPSTKGDERNYHAHILLSACTIGQDGFGKKAAELDPIHCQRQKEKIPNPADLWRGRFAELQNERLKEAGTDARVDHRTLKAQGIDREPTQHLGPAASAYERRTGESSRIRLDFAQAVTERLASAKAAGELEKIAHQVDRSILDLSGDLNAARAERDRRQAEQIEAERVRFMAALDQERQRQAEAERERNKPAPALTIEQAWRMQSRWETALQAERSEYLKELTMAARQKVIDTVAAHQAHYDAKPRFFGKQQWEDRLKGFETKEHLDRLAWEDLKGGKYPFLANDKKAVQEAVEKRLSVKEPELAKKMPEVAALVQAEAVRRQQAQLEISRQVQEERKAAKAEKDNGRSFE